MQFFNIQDIEAIECVSWKHIILTAFILEFFVSVRKSLQATDSVL